MTEIATIMDVKLRTVEQYILDIFENYDNVDVDLEYFNLTEEIELEIRTAVTKVGTQFLKPIKDIVNGEISYSQIKLCLLVMKIENNQ